MNLIANDNVSFDFFALPEQCFGRDRGIPQDFSLESNHICVLFKACADPAAPVVAPGS
jgi:hypothetical protein